jgi:hypothetical protein
MISPAGPKHAKRANRIVEFSCSRVVLSLLTGPNLCVLDDRLQIAHRNPRISLLSLRKYGLLFIHIFTNFTIIGYAVNLIKNLIKIFDALLSFVLGIVFNPDFWFPHALAGTVNGLGRFFGPYGGIISVRSKIFIKMSKNQYWQLLN